MIDKEEVGCGCNMFVCEHTVEEWLIKITDTRTLERLAWYIGYLESYRKHHKEHDCKGYIKC